MKAKQRGAQASCLPDRWLPAGWRGGVPRRRPVAKDELRADNNFRGGERVRARDARTPAGWKPAVRQAGSLRSSAVYASPESFQRLYKYRSLTIRV